MEYKYSISMFCRLMLGFPLYSLFLGKREEYRVKLMSIKDLWLHQ
jgi:hypothetical protein